MQQKLVSGLGWGPVWFWAPIAAGVKRWGTVEVAEAVGQCDHAARVEVVLGLMETWLIAAVLTLGVA